MNSKKLYQAKRNFILRKIAGTNVLVSVGAGVADFNGYIQLNESAVEIWKMLQSPCNEESLVSMLKEKFGVDDVVAKTDVAEYIKELLDNEMIQEKES